MKETIKINFVDFWDGLIKTDNYFYNLLSSKYEVLIDEIDPDIVFFSVDYGKRNEIKKYLGTRAKIIYYTGENQLPNWEDINLAFTFSYDSHGGKNYRLPLWSLHINWFDRPYIEERDQAYLHDPNLLLNKSLSTEKNKFCNFVYTQPKGRRVAFFPSISRRFPNSIESSGSFYNNTGIKIPGRGDTVHKIRYLNQFKYTISFENESSSGYQTEKIIHPMMVNSIPIYWGNPTPETDFNTKSFIFCNNLTDDEICDKIQRIENDEDLYRNILEQPWFVGNDFPDFVKPKNVLKRIEEIL